MSDTLETIFGIYRVEVIGKGGRLLTEYGTSSVTLSLQDGGKTIKVFLGQKNISRNLGPYVLVTNLITAGEGKDSRGKL